MFCACPFWLLLGLLFFLFSLQSFGARFALSSFVFLLFRFILFVSRSFFFYCLLYTGYSFAFGCFLSPFSRSVYLGCWLVCVVVLEYPVRCHGIALSHVLTVRVLHYYPLCRTCDHRACISLESTGCRWVQEHLKNTVPKFLVRLTCDSMVIIVIPCSSTRCIRLFFAYYSEKRLILRTFGPIMLVWLPYYCFPCGVNTSK